MHQSPSSLFERHQQAVSALQADRTQEAHQLCLQILQEDPTFADAWFICAVIAAKNGLVGKAAEIMERPLTLAPENPEYHAEMGRLMIALHQPDRALTHAQIALQKTPTDIPVLNTLGTVFTQAGEHGPALDCYQRGIKQLERKGASSTLSSQWQSELYFNLAASLQFAGQFDAAEAAYEKAISLQPTLFKAHSALATLRQHTPEKNHLERLEQLRDAIETPRDQLHLGHAMAKELEDLGRYEASLEALDWAKARQCRDSGYHFETDRALFDTLRKPLGGDWPAEDRQGCASKEPIFIVGMPRTGTTLVEQILASHSAVFAAGELQNFPLQVKRLTGTPSADVLDLATLEAALNVKPTALGNAYLESTRPRTGHTPRFIDKLPLNFIYLGLIHQALPNAKIVCLRRDPMDTCVSNYRQLFAVDFKHYHYNYDLMTCGQYFIEFDKLMRHWQHVMPGNVHEVSYEALVAEPERHARELLAFCELEWEPQCLEFHQRDTAVATPSAVQVRQGIYQSSVQRWKRYGEHVEPLHALLQSAGLYPAD